jgi:hypothetical protein
MSPQAQPETASTMPLDTLPPRTSRWRASITSFRDDFMGREGKEWKGSPWRHTLGVALLCVTVVLWTTSNFLASVSLCLFTCEY